MSEVLSRVVQELDGSDRWRAYGGSEADAIQEGIPDYLAAKGVNLLAIKGLAEQGDVLGSMLDSLLLGNNGSSEERRKYYSSDRRTAESRGRQRFLNAMVPNSYAERIAAGYYDHPYEASEGYSGYDFDNNSIRAALTKAASEHQNKHNSESQRQFRRNGASRNLWLPGVNLDEAYRTERLTQVPVAIVGCGASGILSAAYLRGMGFENITIFDKRGRGNGIWAQDNVSGGTKNNPFTLNFMERRDLKSAADSFNLEGSGNDIARFLENIAYDASIEPRKAKIISIKPGDLRHEVTFVEDGETKKEVYPIVIYAPGLGEPLDPSDPNRMTTPMKKNEVGQRWQRQLDYGDIEKLGSRVVLIGLGNSTAEIVHQLQQKGRGQVDYRILTHRSLRALLRPDEEIDGSGSSVYRNIKKPELTSLAGDLRHINEMFTQARDSGRIVPNVRHWHHDGSVLTAVDNEGIETRIPFSKLFTLIGYGQNPQTNEAMGLHTADKRTGTIAYDFDGEVQRGGYDVYEHRPRRRIHPGYFAIGPILKTKDNPNALVIPGIQHQLQFMGSTVGLRAAEYAYGNRKPLNVSKVDTTHN